MSFLVWIARKVSRASQPYFVMSFVVWYAVLLTDGPLSAWISLPALVLVALWAPNALHVQYRFAVPVLIMSILVPLLWALLGIAHRNHLSLVIDQAEHFALLALYFPFRWAASSVKRDGMRVWLIPTFVLCGLTITLWLGHQMFHLHYGIRSPILQTALAYNPTSSYRVFLKGDLFLIPAATLLWVQVSEASGVDVRGTIGLAAVLVAAILTETRGLWIAIATAIVWAVCVGRPSRIWIRSSVLLFVITVVTLVSPVGSYVQHRITGLFGSSQDASTRIRAAEAAQLLAAFRHNPIIGSGLGATLQSGFIRAVEKPYLYELTYHQMLFQLGIIGTIAFVAPIVWIIFQALRVTFASTRRMTSEAVRRAGAGCSALVGLLVASATNPYLFSASGILIVVLALVMIDSAMESTTTLAHGKYTP